MKQTAAFKGEEMKINASRALTGLIVIAMLACGLMAQQRDSSETRHGTSAPQSPLSATPEAILWKPAGNGTEFAVLSGSPGVEGSAFVIRLRLADQVRVPPHWHPVDEHITVILGTFYMGMGEKFDETTAKEMPAGSYGFMPKDMRHFGWAKGTTIVQIHGIGPFKTIWVSPPGKPATH